MRTSGSPPGGRLRSRHDPAMIAVSLALVALLLFLNAFYVAAEFAGVSVARSRLQRRAEEGDRLARAALAQIEPPRRLDDYVAACQVGITLTSLSLGAVGQAQLAPLLEPVLERLGLGAAQAAYSAPALVVLVALSVSQMVFGELVPKSLALQLPVRSVRWTALPMRLSSRLLAPFVAVLNGSGRLVLRLLGRPATGEAHVHSPEEIEFLVTESGAGGALEEEDSRRLRRALQLRLRKVRHLMTPRPKVHLLDGDRPLQELVDEVIDGPFTRYPVYRGSTDDILGILHARDVARAVLEGDLGDSRIDALLRPAVAVPESIPGERALEILRSRRVMQLVVFDEYGAFAGILTASDLLQEVLGEVPDDASGALAGGDPLRPLRLPDGRVRLPGRLPVDRAARWTGASWPQGADTVAAAVLLVLGREPRQGETLRIGALPVTVERLEGRAVASVVAGVPEADDG